LISDQPKGGQSTVLKGRLI